MTTDQYNCEAEKVCLTCKELGVLHPVNHCSYIRANHLTWTAAIQKGTRRKRLSLNQGEPSYLNSGISERHPEKETKSEPEEKRSWAQKKQKLGLEINLNQDH